MSSAAGRAQGPTQESRSLVTAAIVLTSAAVLGYVSVMVTTVGGTPGTFVLLAVAVVLTASLIVPMEQIAIFMIAIGWAWAAFISDSNIVDPVAGLSGEVTFSLVKVGPTVLVAGGAIFLLLKKPREETADRKLPTALKLLLLYATWMGLAAILSPNEGLAWLRWVQGAVPVLAVLSLWRHNLNPRFLLLGSLIAALAHVVLARIFPNELQFRDVSRLSGYLHPTMLALVGVLVLCWGLWLIAHKKLIYLVPGALFATAGLWATLGSRSRMGFIALFVGGMAVLLLRGRKTGFGAIPGKRIAIAILGTGGVFLLLTFWLGAVVEWFAREDARQISSLTGRTNLWDQILIFIAERPLVGWGPGAMRAGELAVRFRFELVGFAGQAHNALMEALLTAGVVGGVLWLAFVGSLGRGILAEENENRPLKFGIWALIVVASITDAGSAWFGLVWYLLLSLVAVHSPTDRADPSG